MTHIIVIAVLVAVLFGLLWYTGQLVRMKNYWDQTKVELEKCTWPTWNELKGSTIVVFISMAILGGFTMLVDFVLVWCVRHLT